MKLSLRDAPGNLVAALIPISAAGGNIKTVIHEHIPDAEGNVAVHVVIEIPEEQIEPLKADLAENGITIIRLGKERLLWRETVILIGHLIYTNLEDTINRVDDTGFAEVTYITIAMPEMKGPSSAQLVVRATGPDELAKAIEILRQVAQEKDFLLIVPLGGVA
ncbi:MAG: amino acid-binding protein [Methanomicrobiales archaeon]|nr:amino acid-binding protein [Methanomicrobiales archaeon]